MGQAVRLPTGPPPSDRAVRDRLRNSILALQRMVAAGMLDIQADTCGFELELDLVDSLGRPRLVNGPILSALRRKDFQEELSQANLETNLDPRPIGAAMFGRFEDELSAILQAADAVSQRWGAHLVPIGILPTLREEHLTAERLSASSRYPMLDASMAARRGRSIRLDISGGEDLRISTNSVCVEAAATSLQVHLRVTPVDFPRFFNAAQAVAPAQVATGANSPFLLGRRLWAETRIPLVEQSLDTRSRDASTRQAPRAWIGDHWALSATDILAENVELYPPLIPSLEPDDPLRVLAAGEVPLLNELRLHNGTVWRWNRPVYDVQHGYPQLRIENRVLPSGPSVSDMVANTAFFLGLARAVADLDPPISDRMPFRHVQEDLQSAARGGLRSALHWPGRGRARPREARRLLLDELIPLASAGLDAWRVAAGDRDRYLGIISERVRTGRTGAEWQERTASALEARGGSRTDALRELVRRYVENVRANAPVHEWPV